MRVTRVVSSWVLCAALATSAAAAAQGRDPVAAEALFKQGRTAAEAGNYKQACAKFYESNRLDPAVGTVFNIADCEEKQGHVATAYTKFQEVLQQLTPPDDRIPIAQKRLALLDKRVPKLTIQLAAGAPEGTRVSRDDVTLGAASLGTPLPVDPGTHVISVSAPGTRTRALSVSIAEGRQRSIEVAPGPALPAGSNAHDTGGSARAHGSDHRTLGYVIGGVGVAGLAVGAITGAMVLGKKSTVDNNCDAAKRCNQTGLDAASSGHTLGIVTTTGFIVGAVGVAAGAWLVLSSDKQERPVTALIPGGGPHGAQLTLVRRF
jgi:hypothetical protein